MLVDGIGASDDVIIALPDDVITALSDDVITALSDDVITALSDVAWESCCAVSPTGRLVVLELVAFMTSSDDTISDGM